MATISSRDPPTDHRREPPRLALRLRSIFLWWATLLFAVAIVVHRVRRFNCNNTCFPFCAQSRDFRLQNTVVVASAAIRPLLGSPPRLAVTNLLFPSPHSPHHHKPKQNQHHQTGHRCGHGPCPCSAVTATAATASSTDITTVANDATAAADPFSCCGRVTGCDGGGRRLQGRGSGGCSGRGGGWQGSRQSAWKEGRGLGRDWGWVLGSSRGSPTGGRGCCR
mmetsp:Transcript_30406/g.55274  ORF Transcript_30406/g.55274 Transcript_30406/m.55274 type:complete len:222 (+) Transcript_30406:398-1063(+)